MHTCFKCYVAVLVHVDLTLLQLHALYGNNQLGSLFGEISHNQDDITGPATNLSIAQSLCQKGDLNGTLTIPSSSATPLTNTIYTPQIYTQTQRRLADSFFKDNGYLTEKKCNALGLSRNKMESFVKESFVSKDFNC